MLRGSPKHWVSGWQWRGTEVKHFANYIIPVSMCRVKTRLFGAGYGAVSCRPCYSDCSVSTNVTLGNCCGLQAPDINIETLSFVPIRRSWSPISEDRLVPANVPTVEMLMETRKSGSSVFLCGERGDGQYPKDASVDWHMSSTPRFLYSWRSLLLSNPKHR